MLFRKSDPLACDSGCHAVAVRDFLDGQVVDVPQQQRADVFRFRLRRLIIRLLMLSPALIVELFLRRPASGVELAQTFPHRVP